MKTKLASMLGLMGIALASLLYGAESAKYPAPRFPSYLRPPKSIDDIMPFARAAVRQTGGRTPLGLVEKGMVRPDCQRSECGCDGDAGDQKSLRGTRRQNLHRIRARTFGHQQRRCAKGDARHAVVFVRARLHGGASMDGRLVRRCGGAKEMAEGEAARPVQRDLYQGR